MRRLLLVLTVLGVLAAPATASAKVPWDFFGVLSDGAMRDGSMDPAPEYALMKATGVQTVRAAFYWSAAQPYASAADVPPELAGTFTDVGGVPTDWAPTDALMTSLAQQRLGVLPVILRTPSWAAVRPDIGESPPSPSGVEAYARFCTALVQRYGPGGQFWREHPELYAAPIRRWQVWNEPNSIHNWWSERYDHMTSYVRLLKPAYRALKAADPTATVVLAGLVGDSWRQLDDIYAAGGRGSFDQTAIHPFTGSVKGIRNALRSVRRVMARHGDAAMPMSVTEWTWPAAKGKTSWTLGFEVNEFQQAMLIRATLAMFADERLADRLSDVFYATWTAGDDDPISPFDYQGLRTARDGVVVAKPAFDAFRDEVALLRQDDQPGVGLGRAARRRR